MPCAESVDLVFCWRKGLLADACKKSGLLLTAELREASRAGSTWMLLIQGFFTDAHESHFACDCCVW